MESAVPWRLELFFKTQQELSDRVIPLLKQLDVRRVNLTNKTKDDRLLQSVQALAEALPQVEVCVHYSLKWNYTQGVEPTQAKLASFYRELAAYERASVLLVSGSGKKRKLDSPEALRLLAKDKSIPNVLTGIAYNPYLPNDKDYREEKARLEAKLGSGFPVAAIYLQIGTDLARLHNALEHLDAAVKASPLETPPMIYGSVFLPTKQLLAQMRFRPWNGVFLSEDYLGSIEAAERITSELLEAYRQHGVVPLVESAVRSVADYRRLGDLLGL